MNRTLQSLYEDKEHLPELIEKWLTISDERFLELIHCVDDTKRLMKDEVKEIEERLQLQILRIECIVSAIKLSAREVKRLKKMSEKIYIEIRKRENRVS